jgi:hypothetical protein
MLGGDARFRPLQMHCLQINDEDEEEEDGEDLEWPDDADVHKFAAGLLRQASLERVELSHIPLSMPALLDAVVDAALARRWTSFFCESCELSPTSALALARLLRNNTALEMLHLNGQGVPLLDGFAAALLAAALRANTTLRVLQLNASDLWSDIDAGIVLMRALKAHPSLRALILAVQDADENAAAVGRALGALIAANAPALHTLDVSSNGLGDEGLAPLLSALARNTHLRVLRCGGNGMSAAFARRRLLPAIRANTSLRKLDVSTCGYSDEEDDICSLAPEADDAEALVRARCEKTGDA